MALCCTGALDEQPSQVRVSPFADPKQLLLAARGVLTGHNPHPGRELSPFPESRPVTDRRDQGGRSNGSDARNRHQSLAGFVLLSGLVEQGIGFIDPLRYLVKFQLQLRKGCAGRTKASSCHLPERPAKRQPDGAALSAE